MGPRGCGKLRALVGHPETVVHLGQLKQVFNRAGSRGGGLVVGYRQAPRSRDDEHVGEVAEDARLELLLSRLELAAALQRLILEAERSWILEQAPRACLPVERLDRKPFILLKLELFPGRRQACERLARLHQPAVSLAHIEADERQVRGAPRLHQQRSAPLHDRPEVASGGELAELTQVLLCRACGHGRECRSS